MINSTDSLAIATIRSLVIDMTNNAKSGHPGMAIGSAPILYTLFKNHLVSDPTDAYFINRDRFVLSAGHASPLLYSLLHIGGYKITLDDLKNFRKLGSVTPGHPESTHTDGVDATSGPLGQGIAQAVGMAIAETHLRSSYPDGGQLINHYTYCLCGDGCLQEGLSQEAISLAGHFKLNKLILFYDCNDVTLDGDLSLSCSERTKERFLANNWNYIEVKDGNDIEAIDAAIKKAKRSKDKPTLIKVNTIIGYGSTKQGTNKAHGAPLGEEDGEYTKKVSYGFDHEKFFIPAEVKELFKKTFIKRGKVAHKKYLKGIKTYKENHAKEYELFSNNLNFDNLDIKRVDETKLDLSNKEPISTRNASKKALNAYYNSLNNLIGGSADVASSVMTKIDGAKYYTSNSYDGRVINFGIREFAMASIANGILLHGGLRTYVGSFFVFSDYLKPAIRMAALSNLPSIYLFSHDSIAVGEDGPTHQPIEQMIALRSIPNCNVIRPCDEKEVYGAYKVALHTNKTPSCIILSRQNLPVLDNSSVDNVSKGAYIISDYPMDKKDAIIIATGSEVALALDVQKMLVNEGLSIKVISMPCMKLFNAQDDSYKASILDLSKDKIITLEMGSTFGWGRYGNHNIGIDTFGLSSKASDVINYFGFTKEEISKKVSKILK